LFSEKQNGLPGSFAKAQDRAMTGKRKKSQQIGAQLKSRFTESMAGALWPAAVAVSGGGDSMALMLLLKEWAEDARLPSPHVLTVDHGLRAQSKSDAAFAAKTAKALKLKATVLVWKGAKPDSDIEAEARAARYRLMGAWCRARNIAALYVAHTLDEQAETFLLRLARGSGLDGLSAMRPRSPFPLPEFSDLTIMRPLLGFRRAELRQFLEQRGLAWREDAMNEDTRFARARLRAIWPELEKAGLSAPRIASASAHLARAREALETATDTLLAQSGRHENGTLLLDAAALRAAPREIGLRALAKALGQISGRPYRPRFERLEALYDALSEKAFAARTLHNCRVGRAPKRLALFGPQTLAIEKERPKTGAMDGGQ
jgi:tRNA(Ile)-lysidine synthase